MEDINRTMAALALQRRNLQDECTSARDDARKALNDLLNGKGGKVMVEFKGEKPTARICVDTNTYQRKNVKSVKSNGSYLYIETETGETENVEFLDCEDFISIAIAALKSTKMAVRVCYRYYVTIEGDDLSDIRRIWNEIDMTPSSNKGNDECIADDNFVDIDRVTDERTGEDLTEKFKKA